MSGLVVTLCGSARFERWFKVWNEALTLAGHAVFTLTAFPSDKGSKEWYTPEAKEAFDKAYKLKILRSDAVVLLNVFGYVGQSTLSETVYARRHGKAIYALESRGRGEGTASLSTLDPFRLIAAEYGCSDTVSPIDTQPPKMLDPTSLFGGCGDLRETVISLLGSTNPPMYMR